MKGESIDGDRDIEDAFESEDHVLPVAVHPDGPFTDGCGRHFNLRIG